MSSGQTRSLFFAVVVLVAMLAVGATAATAVPAGDSAVTAEEAVGPDAMANETTVNTTFIGTVADEGTVTVEASGVADNGTPVDGAEVTVTVGGEAATTATVTNGSLEATFDPSVLDIEPTDDAEVNLAGYTVEDPATVEVVHEAFELNASTRLRSVPQGAQLAAENVVAVNVWDAAAGGYEAVTDPVFETASNLHRGLYVTPTGDDGRVGYTFDTNGTDLGTVNLSSGWNYVSSNFDISATANLTVAEDLDLVRGTVSDLDIFSADFSQSLGPNATVEAYDSYWVFVDEDDQPVERNISDSAYNRSNREDVLGVAEGTVSFADQATASSTFTDANATTPGVVVEAEANVDSAVVVTYQNGSDLVIAGLDVFSESELDGGEVTVPVTEFGGFPGEHTAHVIPVDDLSGEYAPGDTVSNATAEAILDNEAATVFQGELTFDDQSYEDNTIEVTAATAALLGDEDALFQVDLHETTDSGAPGTFVGSSPVLSGANEDVPIVLQDTQGNPLEFNESANYVAMIHIVTDENASEGDLFPPGTFPVLPNADAEDGFVPGGVTDGGEVAIFSAEGAELSFDSQAVGVDAQGNAVVYVDNLTAAEQVEQTDVSNPAEDLVVLYEGDTLNQSTLVDFRNVGDAQNGELVLDADGATPGTHTVELFADARFSIDPTATDAGHPFITDTRTDDAASDEQRYILLLEEELTADATADRQTVVEQFKSQAEAAQRPVVDELESMGLGVDSQFWLINAVTTTVDTDEVSVEELTRIDGVERVVRNVKYQLPSPAGEPTAVGSDEVSAQQNYTYGLQQIDVPNFEATFGTQGEGSTVAILDDGISTPENPHPDLNISIAAIAENGEVTTGTLGTPGSHGEHVAGTATGAANPAGPVPRYGVAPAAELIKINVFQNAAFTADIIAGIQFSVANDADVASMSLGFGPVQGLSTVQLPMEAAMQNANAAGTVVIGSAGNSGSGAAGGPVTSPGGEFSGFSVGASDSSRGIAGFSSGTVVTPNTVFVFDENFNPAPYPDTYPRSFVKPDVSAPGVQVLSAGPLGSVVAQNPTYSLSSGTSMAAPHVAGAVALVQSATDVEHDPKTIENALAETAEKPVPIEGRDIRYGTGIINVTAATLALQETTNISGTVTDSATGDTLTGVKITTDTGVVASTDENGTYSIEVTSDVSSVNVTADEFGYTAATQTVAMGSGDQTADFALDPEVDVVPVQGQPAFAEFQDSFTIVADVRNLEEYGVELADTQGVTPADINVTVAGTTISPGETITLGGVDANGVPVVVEIDGTFEEGDQFALAHSFGGPGEDVEVTTGPTTLTETQAPANFELSGFSAPPGQELGQAEPYAVSVNVTNVGQTPGEAEIRWFLGPLGLQGDNPVESLAPGETTQVALNFGEIDIGGFFGGVPVNLLQGFDAVPTAPAASGDLTFTEFTVGSGQVPLFDPIDPTLPRGAAQTTTVYDASVSIDDQRYDQPTSEVTVSSSQVLPDSQEYVIVIHEATEGLPVLGNSGNLTGTQENVTVSLDTQLNTTTDVVAMVHFADGESAFGAPITAFDPVAGGLVPVTDTATVDAGPTGTVNGTVTASGDTASTEQAAGEPVAGANVTLYRGNSTDPADVFATTTTDGNGTYSFSDVTTGNYTAEANASEFVPATETLTVVSNQTETVDFALDYAEAGAVSGEISLSGTDPGEDVNVTVTVVETGNATTVTLSGAENTTTYTIPDVDVNVGDGYTVTASEDTGNYTAPADATNVTVDVGATTENVDFTFTRETGNLNGTVTNATGTPIEGATVEVFAFGAGGPQVANVTTDATGAYSVPDLPVGEHFVTVSVDGSEADNATATIRSNQTTTVDFALSEANFAVTIDGDLTGAANETQTATVTVENTGDLPDTQTLTLDWGDGAYTDTGSVALDGGNETVTTLSITTDATQALGVYNVTVASADDTDEANATLGPQRSLNQTTVAPGGTVNVTVSGQVGESANISFADEWSPAANNSAIVDTSFTPEFTFPTASKVAVISDGEVGPGAVEIVYEIYISDNATAGTVYEWEPAQGDDGSFLQVGDDALPVFGDQSFEVTADGTVTSRTIAVN